MGEMLFYIDNHGRRCQLPSGYKNADGQIFELNRAPIYLVRHSGIFGRRKQHIPLYVGNHVWMYLNFHKQIYLGKADGMCIFGDLEEVGCVCAIGIEELQRMFNDRQLTNPNEIEP